MNKMEEKILYMSVEERMNFLKKILSSPESRESYERIVKESFYDIVKSATLDLKPEHREFYEKLSEEYCRNGKCINLDEKYVCCTTNCKKEKPCTVTPDECLYFFCDFVLEKLSKEQREAVDLEVLFQHNNKWNDAIEQLIKSGFIEITPDGSIIVKGEC